MAGLDEIMSGASGRMPEGQDDHPQTQNDGGFTPSEPAYAPQGGSVPQVPQPQPNEADDDDVPDQGGMVPKAALDAERGKRRKYTDEVKELREQVSGIPNLINQAVAQALGQVFSQNQRPQEAPPPAPDFWENPEAVIAHRLQGTIAPIQQQVDQRFEMFSRVDAIRTYGEETVNAAYQEIARRCDSDPDAAFALQRIKASPHPFDALVQWFNNQPSQLEQRIRQQLMAEMQGQGQPQGQSPAPMPQQGSSQQHAQPGAPRTPMPTSFAGAPNQGPRSVPQWQGPRPLSEIMNARR